MTTSNPQQQPEQQPEQPSALTLWNEHIAALADPAQADGAINEIYAGLMDLHSHLTAIGQAEQAAKAAEAYNMALALYNSHQQHSVVVAGGAAAIQEIEAARQQTAVELRQLLKAIEDLDEEHPALAGYAESIRQDEYEYAMYESEEGNTEYYSEIFDDAVREDIARAWKAEGHQSSTIYEALTGNFTLKKTHAEMLQRIISELPRNFAEYQAYKKAVEEEAQNAGQ